MKRLKKQMWMISGVVLLAGALTFPVMAKKKSSPYDKYDHDKHNDIFDAAKVECELCHSSPDSFEHHEKINPQGCHACHRAKNPPIKAPHDCKICHDHGVPKPESHKTRWLEKHQWIAKESMETCMECHQNKMFCENCHMRRDTVVQKVHDRNFRFFHSIEARANPRKCDACHTVTYCQQCHNGQGTSLR